MIRKFLQWMNENRLWGLFITAIVMLVVCTSYIQEKHWEASTTEQNYGYYSLIEFPLIDFRHRLLSQPKKANDDIVIVTITENAIKTYQGKWGRWPWPRAIMADVLQYLRKADNVMLDIAYLEKSGVEIQPEDVKKLDHWLRQGLGWMNKSPKRSKRYINAALEGIQFYKNSGDKKLGRIAGKYDKTHFATWLTQIEEDSLPKEKIREFIPVFDQYGYGLTGDTSDFLLKANFTTPIEPVVENTDALAHITFSPDPDGPARRFQPFLGIKSYPEHGFKPKYPYLPILGLSGALGELGLDPGQHQFEVKNSKIHLTDELEIPLDRQGNVLINYRGGLLTESSSRAFQDVPIENIVSPIVGDGIVKNPPSPDFFEGKQVFIGATAPGMFDLRATPYTADEAGVAIHANIIDMVLSNNFLEPIHASETVITIVGLTLTVGVIATFLSPMIALALTFLITGLYFITALGLYNQGKLINISAPLISSYMSYGLILVYNLFFEQQKRRQIKNAFEHYLTSSVMEEILNDPDKLELGGERREISVLFADVAGFTTFSEGKTATEVAEVINDILTEMTECIFRYEGVLDKYIGDEMVAEFGIIPVEPDDHATRAVNAAVDMRLRMREMREKWREENHPLLQLRIGVHTGMAATGNMGSEMLFDYTALGDNVNLGSRLEGANKQYNTLSMISEDTYSHLDGGFEVRQIDSIIVKGKDEPITVYELLGRGGDVSEDVLTLRDRFEQGLELYRAQNWDDAIDQFESILDDHPEDGPAEIFLERCHEFKQESPAEDWDGVYRLTEK